ncbi:MAG: cytochrome c oxidase accessory protein CcoG [Bradymonadaceae bacterium]|nr:cytochrome c oxidase accessory protein CcoG [Lujinxingiaceae bacterium]
MNSTSSCPGPVLESPEEVLSTMNKDGKRLWVYPTPSKGTLWKWRLAVAWALIAFFVALPLVKIQGKPAIFLDLLHREFTFFGLTLYATDTTLLMVFLLLVLVSVFLATALLGRVWCGWGCPQTVYLEFVFRPIERFFEGKENARKRRDAGPWTPDRVVRKGLKLAVYLLLSFGLAHTFVAYFVSWEVLQDWMQRSPTEHWGFFVMMAMTTGLIFGNFGYFREQMCTIACPYARFQSVLMDRDSLIVSYDPGRGEPRKRRSGEERAQEKASVKLALGDCVDCGACVRTCPTGIDIRNGLQMECVGCTQCIDACDAIMISVNKPKGLIRYTSENVIEKKPARIIRTRVLLYAAIMVSLTTIFAILITSRTPIDINLGRVVGEPFAVLQDGEVINRLRFRVQNRTNEELHLSVVALEPAGTEVKLSGPAIMHIAAGATHRVEAFVVVPPTAFTNGSSAALFEIMAANKPALSSTVAFTLLGPSTPKESKP